MRLDENAKDELIVHLMRKLKGRATISAEDLGRATRGMRLAEVPSHDHRVLELRLLPPVVNIEGEFRVVDR